MHIAPKFWLYALNKAKLISEMEIHGIDTEGTVDENPGAFQARGLPEPKAPPTATGYQTPRVGGIYRGDRERHNQPLRECTRSTRPGGPSREDN